MTRMGVLYLVSAALSTLILFDLKDMLPPNNSIRRQLRQVEKYCPLGPEVISVVVGMGVCLFIALAMTLME